MGDLYYDLRWRATQRVHLKYCSLLDCKRKIFRRKKEGGEDISQGKGAKAMKKYDHDDGVFELARGIFSFKRFLSLLSADIVCCCPSVHACTSAHTTTTTHVITRTQTKTKHTTRELFDL